jgi:hypothetical protein
MKRYGIVLLAAAAIALASCTTTDHRLTLVPPDVPVPVSASAFYAAAGGQVVSPDGYTVIDHFALTKAYRGPVGVKGYTSVLDIAPDLTPLVQAKQADAVVNLRIIPKSYDPGNAYSVGALKIAGSFALGFGGMFALMSLADDSLAKTTGPMALAFCGVGGGSLGASIIMRQSGRTTWTVGVEGDMVKRR